MKKCLCILTACWAAIILGGCGDSAPVFETIGQISAESAAVPPNQIVLDLPREASESESGDSATTYLCNGYTLSIQTLQGGDLGRTLKQVTGFEKEKLRLFETEVGKIRRCDCVWTAAGEPELQIGRACILDDGTCHYVVSTVAQETKSGESREAWAKIYDSFRLIDGSVALNTGS